jgi:hypothetical protein
VIFHESGADRRLLDHGGELADIHLRHAPVAVAGIEIAAEQLILLLGRPGRAGLPLQVGIAPRDAALRAARLEQVDRDSGRQAGRAVGAGRAIGHRLAAPEAPQRQLVVHRNGIAAAQRGEHLPLFPVRQVGAGLRGGQEELGGDLLLVVTHRGSARRTGPDHRA